MRYEDIGNGKYFVAPANPTQIYQKINDTHAVKIPSNDTLELGRPLEHVDPERDMEVVEAPEQPPTPPAEPK